MDALRAAGLSEVDIFHVVLAVAIRRFFAGVMDAVGAEPDAHLREMEMEPDPQESTR
jgi:alkylhydroperoxidase family enzyme